MTGAMKSNKIFLIKSKFFDIIFYKAENNGVERRQRRTV